jgi:TetR/AcrR family transcriptional regulator
MPGSRPKHDEPRTRDPEGTRKRILDAAEKEFATHGFAATKVRDIAKRASINVRMLYHYFGDKDELYRAILQRQVAVTPNMPPPGTEPMGEQLGRMFRYMTTHSDWVRLTLWESLEYGEDPVVDEKARRERMTTGVPQLRAEGVAGQIDPEFDPEMLLIAMLAVASYPAAFTPSVRMITGLNPSSRRFKQRYAEFLDQLVAHMAPRDPTPDRDDVESVAHPAR